MATEGRHYQILSVLGRGGFGTVFRAKLSTEGGFSKIVALKVLNPDMEGVAEVASRMRDEARLLGMVNHRAVVQVDALVVLDGKWTVVMEYVDGADVQTFLKRGAAPIGPALEVARELGGALDFAFQAPGPDGNPLRLLHRDIKPGNVRITPAGEVKLLDFGIARADFGSREAATKALSFGTPDYMSPERFEFTDGPEGDVYAVGVIVWEMLTGEHFGKTSPAQERHDAKVMAALDKLWQATGGRSEDLVRFVGAMLAFDPAARPTAREVERRATELWRTLGDKPLRDWVETVLPTLTSAEEEAVPESLKSKMLTENIRSGAFAYPTEKLNEGAPGQPPPFGSAAVSPPLPLGPPASPSPMPPPQNPGVSMNDYSSQQITQPKGGGGVGIWIALGLLGLVVLFGAIAAGGYFYWKSTQEGGSEEATSTSGDNGSSTTTTSTSSSSSTSGSSVTSSSDGGATTTTSSSDGTRTVLSSGSSTTTTVTASPEQQATDEKATDEKATDEKATDTKSTDEKATDEKATDEKATEEKKPTTGMVTVTGGAKVRLVGSKGSFGPGRVPAGTYSIRATFAGSREDNAGSVTVPAGGSVTVVCSKGTGKCSAR